MRTRPRLAWISLPLMLLVAATAATEVRVPGVGDEVLAGEPLYSQNKEELIVRHFFGDRRDGVYLDVGAFHWRRWSTTYYLEEHLGWSGVAVDALPEVAEGWRRNRPGAQFFQYIVTDHSGSIETLYGAGGLSSIHEDHLESYAGEKIETQRFQVPTITLDELLELAGVEHIDFLSMDIEQAEPLALAGFDIERFRPALVCIEATESIRKEIAAYFARHGYERIDAYLEWDTVNWYYTPRDADGSAPLTWGVPLVAAAVVLMVVGGVWVRRQQRHG
ncbi:MAG: FkbM family methyltransferase [Deltaproteobacteria bacterium]|nr:FkbM family methyltransferase [Deltaproteobacteria bacterium]MBW2359737.1 FkbM family methyltransferase [Deltaproteobacteria bacterium]